MSAEHTPGSSSSTRGYPAGLRVLAPAKINLTLEILGRRDDGYHDLDTVMTAIDLADTVRLRPAAALDVRLSGRYAPAVEGERELAAEAAKALAAAAGREPDVSIEVEKAIPVAAGLGGGSSDAAAVLRGLDRLWGLGWPAERLAEVGAQLGSDVPFFLHGGSARCTGRGEIVEPLRDLRPLRLLVLVPPVPSPPNKTAQRFAAVQPHDLSHGERSHRIAHRLERGAPPPTADLWNAFEHVVERTESELLAHYGAYAAVVGGAPLHLTGAGPSVFLLAHERAKVAELRRDLEGEGATVFPAQTLSRADSLAIVEEPTSGEPTSGEPTSGESAGEET